MTSSGNCHKCGKICSSFFYTEEYTGNGHKGFWHCDQHGPKQEITTTNISRGKPINSGMNRAERRALKRKGKVSE